MLNNFSCYQNFSKSEIPKLIDNCIDTTGVGDLITINKIEYKSSLGDQTYMVGTKRFRYTNSTHTDSLEVAHVLHFRDSSIQGYDTLINGGDTTFGVWKHSYVSTSINKDGDTITKPATGPMVPSFFLNNTTGCERRGAQLLNVGHYSDFSINNQFAESFIAMLMMYSPGLL